MSRTFPFPYRGLTLKEITDGQRSELSVTHIFVEIGHDLGKRVVSDRNDDKVFMHFQPKGKKRNVREYLRSGEPEER